VNDERTFGEKAPNATEFESVSVTHGLTFFRCLSKASDMPDATVRVLATADVIPAVSEE